MKISRDNMKAVADIVLRVFARGLCAVSLFDKRVAADIEALGDGFSFVICAGAGENPPYIMLKTENGRFARTHADVNGSDVVIRFKDVSGAIPVLLGKASAETAFAQHRMLVWGSINQAVALVRIIGVTEAYLFPKLMIKKTMRRVPKKQVPGLFIYIMLLFFGVRKPPRLHAPAGAADEELDAAGKKACPSGEDNEATEGLEAAK